MHGHGTRPVGLRVLRPETAMMNSLPTWGRCRPGTYERPLTQLCDVRKHIAPFAENPQVTDSGRRVGVLSRRNPARYWPGPAQSGWGAASRGGGGRGRGAGGRSRWGARPGGGAGGGGPEPVARTAWARARDEPTSTTSCLARVTAV